MKAFKTTVKSSLTSLIPDQVTYIPMFAVAKTFNTTDVGTFLKLYIHIRVTRFIDRNKLPLYNTNTQYTS